MPDGEADRTAGVRDHEPLYPETDFESVTKMPDGCARARESKLKNNSSTLDPAKYGIVRVLATQK